jgi:hypothetical protein
MLKQIFRKKLGKLNTPNFPETNDSYETEMRPPAEQNSAPIDRNFSFADAERLAELLTEESVNSRTTFFRQHPRRPRASRSISEGPLRQGIIAPSSTPDSTFLSPIRSTSTTSISRSYEEARTRTSNISLVETCSTAADTETAESPPMSISMKERDFERSALGSAVREEITNTTTITSNNSGSSSPCLSIQTAKRWGRTFVHDFTAPIRKYQIRQGKQPLPDSTVDPVKSALSSTAKKSQHKLPKRELEVKLSGQSTSQSLQCYNLKGGNGPPKPLSVKAFAKLDHFEQEIVRISKELAQVTKEKEDFLRRIESDDFVDEEEEIVQKSKKNKKKKRGGKKDVNLGTGLFKKNGANTATKFFGMK